MGRTPLPRVDTSCRCPLLPAGQTNFAAIADLVGSVDGLPADLSQRRKAYLRTTGYGQKRSRFLGAHSGPPLTAFLRRRAVVPAFKLGADVEPVLKLLDKYADVPMSLADACLVRMTETVPSKMLLTTDADFRIYRRHSRQAVPCVIPD